MNLTDSEEVLELISTKTLCLCGEMLIGTHSLHKVQRISTPRLCKSRTSDTEIIMTPMCYFDQLKVKYFFLQQDMK